MKKSFVLALLALSLMGSSRFTFLYIKCEKFAAEIADTPEKHSLGLMFRTSLAKDAAMLFVFDDEQIRSFWMKNTLIHLDIIFLNRQKQIVDIYVNVPPCQKDPCPSYVSRVPAQYVVEIKGGRSADLDLKIGDSFFFVY